jgi:pimeloyl-ACP methyl ester carboxylesterase
MTTFVLVPGAWLGAWAWDDVAQRLRTAGHDVHAVTLPGLAERADETPAASIDLSSHVDDVLALLHRLDLRDATLVVHSYAGVVGSVVADRAPERLARVVYVATRPVPDGMALFDLLGPEGEQAVRGLALAAGDPDLFPVMSDELLDLYYPRHGLAGDVLARFRRHATPHPIGTEAEKAKLSNAGDQVPKTMIWCTGDGPAPITPATPGWTYRELAAGHWPMLTAPDLLTEALLAG